ncbi:ORF37L [Turbot reddish body iridovirus]|uniref:ORF37L n=1 Tax=Turbot reddish body iridovirus TaxID=273651 RepID=E2CTY2_ISKNV|nr:ORF37L [Turbot reddish body iridovirus]
MDVSPDVHLNLPDDVPVEWLKDVATTRDGVHANVNTHDAAMWHKVTSGLRTVSDTVQPLAPPAVDEPEEIPSRFSYHPIPEVDTHHRMPQDNPLYSDKIKHINEQLVYFTHLCKALHPLVRYDMETAFNALFTWVQANVPVVATRKAEVDTSVGRVQQDAETYIRAVVAQASVTFDQFANRIRDADLFEENRTGIQDRVPQMRDLLMQTLYEVLAKTNTTHVVDIHRVIEPPRAEAARRLTTLKGIYEQAVERDRTAMQVAYDRAVGHLENLVNAQVQGAQYAAEYEARRVQADADAAAIRVAVDASVTRVNTHKNAGYIKADQLNSTVSQAAALMPINNILYGTPKWIHMTPSKVFGDLRTFGKSVICTYTLKSGEWRDGMKFVIAIHGTIGVSAGDTASSVYEFTKSSTVTIDLDSATVHRRTVQDSKSIGLACVHSPANKIYNIYVFIEPEKSGIPTMTLMRLERKFHCALLMI